MEIVEFYNCGNRDHWLNEIKCSDWDAGQFLYELISDNRLKELLKEMEGVLPDSYERKNVLRGCGSRKS